MSEHVGVLSGVRKTCTQCGERKDAADFYRRKAGVHTEGNLSSYCKACSSETSRRMRARTAEAADARAREYALRLVAGEPYADFRSLPRAVRVHLLGFLDTPGRSVQEVASLAGCSLGTVYRHRSDQAVRRSTDAADTP